MALSDAEKRRIVDMLDNMSTSRARAITSSESSFLGWLKRAARWLFDKIGGTLVSGLVAWLFGLFG